MTPEPTRLCTLGTLALEPEGETGLAGRTKLLHLLAYLAGESGRAVPREQLAALLWGDRPEARARASLREALSRLRSALGGAIEVDRTAARVRPDLLRLDVHEFEAAAREGRLEHAARLYGGDFLAGAEAGAIDEFRTWVEGERERLRHLYRDVVARLVAEGEARADWAAAAAWAERWVTEAPLSASAHRALVRTLALGGRSAEAAGRWAAFAAVARRELGAEPDPPSLPPEAAAPAATVRRRVGPAAVFTPDLVGRQAVFQQLADAWEEARAGGGRGVLIRGESGMGRSRLLRELGVWIETRGEPALVLRATGHAAERDLPYALARPLLAPLRHARGLSGAADGALAELTTLVPEIRDRFPALPAPRGDALALDDALRRVLEDLAAEMPVVLCVDDADRADDASLRLLLALARHLPPRTLMVLTAGAGEESRRRLDPGAVEGALTPVSLPPLSAADIEAMVASMIAMEPAERRVLAGLVQRASAGNPFVAAEQVATLVDEGHLLAGHDGVWRVGPELDGDRLPVPATVADATARRIGRLPEPLRETLAVAALLWPDSDPELLAAVSGLSAAATADRLDALLARRLLRPTSDAAWGYQFAHDVLRRVAYEGIPTHRRAALHAAAARLLRERGRQTDGARRAATRHRERAGEGLLRGPPGGMASSGITPGSPISRWRRRGAVALVIAALVPLAALAWARVDTAPGTAEAGGARARIGSAGDPVASESDRLVLAVGGIADRSAGDPAPGARSDSAAAALRDLLGTHLVRLPEVRVIGGARLVEMRQVVELETGGPSCDASAARRAGADQLLDGSLYPGEAGGWRLDLRRLDLQSGLVRSVHTMEAGSLFDLARRATALMAAELGVAAPVQAGAAPSSASAVAIALYEEGLRAYYRGDRIEARRRFEAALEEDSAFAMAAYYAGLSAWHPDAPAALDHFERARALTATSGDRERLLIRGAWADLLDEPVAAAYADSLVARFPGEPMGYYLRGRALVKAGAFLDAVPFFRHVLEMGALAPGPRSTPRHGDDAAAELASAYAMADSLHAAERVVRAWIVRTPASALAWMRLRDILEHQERFDEALSAAAVVRRLHAIPDAYDATYPALIDLKRGRFAAADSALDRLVRDGDRDVRRQARWFRLISRRWQGRLDEALEDALVLRRSGGGAGAVGGLPPYDALAQAQVLFERGENHAAAALFDSLAATFSTDASEGHSAHQRTWMLTHAAGALAAAHDTAALRVLADSLERVGRRSSQGRDWVLHHHVRGLLALEHGDLAAAERELRQALFSRRAGFTRTNYLLAGVLLRRGRAREAVQLLQPIFRSPVDVSNFYLARPRARALLGRAWLAAGEPDSALYHLRRVEAAWSGADPAFDGDRTRIRSWIDRALAARREAPADEPT